MLSLQNAYTVIDQQLDSSMGTNLYYQQRDASMEFNQDTLNLCSLIPSMNAGQLANLVDYAVSKTLQCFYQSNQYISATSADKELLKAIYRRLVSDLSQPLAERSQLRETYLSVQKRHYDRLSVWMAVSNPFIKQINPPQNRNIPSVVCAQYSPLLQLEVLAIQPEALKEPVLDLGCGQDGQLVKYLRHLGIEAIGIDRLCSIDRLCDKAIDYLFESDWLEYDFKPNHWGTVLANLSFSNHFFHHHLREDGNYNAYAQKYMQILQSLQCGGRFHYAPSLPFIESLLLPSQFAVQVQQLNSSYSRTIVEKL